MSSLSPFTFSDPIQGVQVKPMTQDGQQIRIRYSGSLRQNRINQIWLHGGFGNESNWNNIEDHLMEQVDDGWEQTIQLKGNQLNFCFLDSVNNWDNNDGANWIYRIT